MNRSTNHRPVFVASDNIVSSLGFTTDENMMRLSGGQTGIQHVEAGLFSHRALPFAPVNDAELNKRAAVASIPGDFTRLERMMLLSASDALRDSGIDTVDNRTVFVISSTKGNIDELSAHSTIQSNNSMLWALGDRVRKYFGNPNQAVFVSNACVSGVLSVEIAARMLRNGQYDHAVVVGGDMVTRFVVSGFDSFLALSGHPCRPYDANRDGLTLGEGCATLVLTVDQPLKNQNELIAISGGASSSDAVHISAPDRAGTGLSIAIDRALKYSGIRVSEIDAVCAHGTATVYNDDMESCAMYQSGLSETPVYSLKGYWGHTLGAAGLMETVAVVHSIRQQRLFSTIGFESPGTVRQLNVVDQTKSACLRHILKTASGFGGCNATLVVSKITCKKFTSLK